MNILSLFDGISCARVALERAGIKVHYYYASEIDKYAIEIAQKNYSNITHIGDVKNIITYNGRLSGIDEYGNGILSKIDLLIGGSPCQDLSIAKKNRKGLAGQRSGLFYEYLRILKETKPKYFILENVASMPEEAKKQISELLGVQPIMINASLVSAQNRRRLFWTNIPNIKLPVDKGIYLKHIIHENTDKADTQSYVVIDRHGLKEKLKSNTIRVGGRGSGLHSKQNWDSLQIGHLYEGATEHKGVLNKYVRKLTVIECERLQGLPDNYTYGISNTQRYKTLGNAFNVDVVAHILNNIGR